jgi:hypothetical protein
MDSAYPPTRSECAGPGQAPQSPSARWPSEEGVWFGGSPPTLLSTWRRRRRATDTVASTNRNDRRMDCRIAVQRGCSLARVEDVEPMPSMRRRPTARRPTSRGEIVSPGAYVRELVGASSLSSSRWVSRARVGRGAGGIRMEDATTPAQNAPRRAWGCGGGWGCDFAGGGRRTQQAGGRVGAGRTKRCSDVADSAIHSRERHVLCDLAERSRSRGLASRRLRLQTPPRTPAS